MLSYRVNLMFRRQKMCQRQWLRNGSLSKNEATIGQKWYLEIVWGSWTNEREEKVISNFVACKACKKVMLLSPAMELSRLESTTAVKVIRVL